MQLDTRDKLQKIQQREKEHLGEDGGGATLED